MEKEDRNASVSLLIESGKLKKAAKPGPINAKRDAKDERRLQNTTTIKRKTQILGAKAENKGAHRANQPKDRQPKAISLPSKRQKTERTVSGRAEKRKLEANSTRNGRVEYP